MMLKQGLCTVAAGAAIAASIAGCGGGASSNASTSTGAAKSSIPGGALLHQGVLTTGAETDFPPYDFLDANGRYEGFDADLTKALASALGVQSHVVDTEFTSLIPSLQAHKYDAIISMLYITAERAKQVDYIPYVNVTSSFLVKKGGSFQPQGPGDLCGKRVSVNKGSFNETLLGGAIAKACKAKGQPAPSIRSFPTDTQAALEVSSGRADVNFEDTGTAVYRVKQQPNLKLVLSNAKPLYPIAVGMAVRKGDTATRAVIERGLKALQQNGSYDKLLHQWGLQAADAQLARKAMAGS